MNNVLEKIDVGIFKRPPSFAKAMEGKGGDKL